MKKLLKHLVTSIVDKPKKVEIGEESQGEEIRLTCKVDKEDMGRLIGKGGKTIKAIRNLLRTKAGREKKRVFLILEEATS